MIFSNRSLSKYLFNFYEDNDYDDFEYGKNIFDTSLSNIPSSIIYLTLSNEFNQQCYIPLNIKYLRLFCNNLYLINFLPNSIIKLELSHSYNLQMDNLQTLIKKLTFVNNHHYDADLNYLPDFIEEL